MTFQPNYSRSRRAAIRRAQRAVVILAGRRSTVQAARELNAIVNDATDYTDTTAWQAVQALEDLTVGRHRPPDRAQRGTGGTASTRRPVTTPDAPQQDTGIRAGAGHVDLAPYALDRAAHPRGSSLEVLDRLARQGNAGAHLLLELRTGSGQVRRCAVCGQPAEDLRPLFVADTWTGDTPEAAGYGACRLCANVVSPSVVARAAQLGWRGAPDD